MPGRRSALRRNAWIVLMAFVQATFVLDGRGAHAHVGLARTTSSTDFCTSAPPVTVPVTLLPAPPSHHVIVSTHCRDCVGGTGGSVPAPPSFVPGLVAAPAPAPAVVAVPPATTTIDVATATSRGPPYPA